MYLLYDFRFIRQSLGLLVKTILGGYKQRDLVWSDQNSLIHFRLFETVSYLTQLAKLNLVVKYLAAAGYSVIRRYSY